MRQLPTTPDLGTLLHRICVFGVMELLDLFQLLNYLPYYPTVCVVSGTLFTTHQMKTFLMYSQYLTSEFWT